MVKRLLRQVSKTDHHKLLDLFYLMAGFIGLFNILEITKYMGGGHLGLSLFLFLFSFILMTLAGATGYVSHLKGRIWEESVTIYPILAGLLLSVGGYLVRFYELIPEDSYSPSVHGISLAIVCFVIIEAVERKMTINRIKRQLQLSNKELKQALKTPPAKIQEKAREIISNIEA